MSDGRSLTDFTPTVQGTTQARPAPEPGRSGPGGADTDADPSGPQGSDTRSAAGSEAQPWLWQGHRIAWSRSGQVGATDVVLLIHGFGASLGHWRHTVPALSPVAEVLAVDLLGFGASDKPASRLADEPERPGTVRYCFDLWTAQVLGFLAAQVPLAGRRLHLIGNSVGAVVALNTALALQRAGTPAAQVVLIDCAQRTLDRKRLKEQPPLQQTFRPWLEAAVRQRWLLGPLFRLLARPSFIRQVLTQAYPSGANVDAELIELLHRPSTEAGALESFRGFVNLFDDHLAPQLLAQLAGPVRMIWGDADPWEDPAEARRWAAEHACIRELQVLEGLGHCPHDEAPERVNPILLRWIAAEAG